MKKGIWVVLLFAVFAMLLVGCKPAAWAQEDFWFYNDDDEPRANLTSWSNEQNLKYYSDLHTFREVKIGDKATEAIAKYNMPYGCAGYYIVTGEKGHLAYTKEGILVEVPTIYDERTYTPYKRSINLDELFSQAAGYGYAVYFGIALDTNFKPLKTTVNLKYTPNWYMLFAVEDEVIVDVVVVKHISRVEL